MKVLLIIVTLMTTLFSLKAQDSIQGIYKFKPGLTTADVMVDIAKELNTKIELINSETELIKRQVSNRRKRRENGEIYLLSYSDKSLTEFKDAPYEASFENRFKCFYISAININDIEVKSLSLVFENDTLIYLKCDTNQDFENALNAKYGKPVLHIDRSDIKCIYKLTGNEEVLKDETFISNWRSGFVEAKTILSHYHDDHCQDKYLSYFIISINSKYLQFQRSNYDNKNAIMEDISSKESKSAKQKLKDF